MICPGEVCIVLKRWRVLCLFGLLFTCCLVLQLCCSAEDTTIPARGKQLVKTDLTIICPPGTYGRVAPRSGLAWKNFIDTGAGVIDEDYRGPLGVLLFNHSDTDFQGEALLQPAGGKALMLLQMSCQPLLAHDMTCCVQCFSACSQAR
jgi:hypothetical protein